MLLPTLRSKETFRPLNGRHVHYLFWARNAIYHGLSALDVKPGDNVLVPAFHCTSAVQPILSYGGEVKFYDVNLDLSPNFDDIRGKIDHKTRAILAIHYFGFPQQIRKFKELCQMRNLYLIEDCAHVLTGSTGEGMALGDTGDISVFSWRKFFPLYDGGQLVINNPKLKWASRLEQRDMLLSLKIAKNTLERLFEDSTGRWVNRLSLISHAASSLSRYCLSFNAIAARARNVNSYEVEFDPNCVNLGMSNISRRILDRTNIATVVEERRSNYYRLSEAVQTMRGVTTVYPRLPDHVCPWVFPLLVHGSKDLHLILRAKGIPATTWGSVIHPSLPLGQFSSARFLYDNLVFLPVHQSLKEKDLQMITTALGETLQERASFDAKSIDDRISLSAASGR
jgi:dTDP-4-amino-4,6-dideoxygalactose transaminase